MGAATAAVMEEDTGGATLVVGILAAGITADSEGAVISGALGASITVDLAEAISVDWVEG